MESDIGTLREFKDQLDKWPKNLDSRKAKTIIAELDKLNPAPILEKFKQIVDVVKRIAGTNPGTAGSDSEKDVIEFAKRLLKKWKVTNAADAGKAGDKKGPAPAPGQNHTAVPPFNPPPKLDTKRAKTLTMFYKMVTDAIMKKSSLDVLKSQLDSLKKAIIAIENEVYTVHTGGKYDERMKEIILNIRQHPDMASKIASGDVDPKFMATCDAINLANPETQKKVEQLKQKLMDEADLDKEPELLPVTKDHSCPKCDHMEAYFNERQVRSADEPATLFLKCKKCETCWSFNQ